MKNVLNDRCLRSVECFIIIRIPVEEEKKAEEEKEEEEEKKENLVREKKRLFAILLSLICLLGLSVFLTTTNK